MYFNFFILPLLSILIIGFLGRYLGIRGVYKILILNLIILISLSFLLIFEYFLDGNILKINIWNSLINDILYINYYLYLDDLSQLMLLIIISITLLVIIYSYDYMILDPHLIRFYLYIILFIFFMIILITTNSIPILFIGWEGVGLSSFLLISFWYTRFNTQIGGLIALLMNRVGDIFYLIGLFFSLIWLGSYDIISNSIESYINWDYILITFFIAAMAKSAQVYLHLWLPYSMEGPTPISALIHAATMVTAGIYLLLRLNQLLIFSYYTLFFILIIGTLTAFIGGTLAIIALDMKELIAYSTMSQLGYMISILSFKFFNLAFFHLIFHAYFKALLFLTAGAIIHTILDIQDLRKTGGLLHLLSFQSILSLIGLFSLIGFPFTTGFYSKEAILNNSYSIISLFAQYSYLILLISALLTIFYSFNFFNIIFISTTRLSLFSFKNLHYFSYHLLLPLFILSLFTIFFGFIFHKWINIFNFHLLPFSFNIPIIIKFIPLFFMILVFIFSYFIFYSNIKFDYLFKQYSFKLLYQFFCGFFLNISYRILYKLFDYGIFDIIGPISSQLLVYKLNINKLFYINPISFLLFLFFFFILI